MRDGRSIATSRISLFGGFQIEKEAGGSVWLTGKRGPAILAYLARCPGMAAPRERLADLLWSDSDSEHSRNSLRQTLSVLRRDLSRAGIDIIHSRRDLIGLRPDAVRVDVEDFETGLSARSAPELQTALALYTGPFLDGFYVGSNAFDDWAASERERLASRALESMEKLARLVDVESGLAVADRILAMEPTREESYRLKMELLVACGQRDKALRTFETCRSVLKKEFGVDVSPETKALWQSLLSTEFPSNPQTANGTHAGQRQGRPSIGVAEFVNLTGERGDDFFAKGLVHDITTALSEVADYVVLSGLTSSDRNGEEPRSPGGLRARYTLKGSIQRSGDELRVNVQLVDAADGHNVWAQKFDGHSENALDFQDRIARSVVLAVSLELQLTNWKVRDKSPAGAPEVRRLVNEALMKYFEMTRDSLLVSKQLAEKALSIAPENARAKRTLSIATTMGIAFGALPGKREHVDNAIRLAEDSVRAVPDDEIARCILSFAYLCDGRIDEAIVECRHAVSLNPSYPSGHGDLGELYALRGQVSEALRSANEAIRLGAHDVIDFWRHHGLAVALFAGGDDRRAVEVARTVVRTKPGFVRGALYWAAAASATRNNEEASRAIHHCLSQLPHLNLGNVCPGFLPRYVRDDHHARFLEMLSRAGLPKS
ncbi:MULTISPECIES: BTAD domain-containing putative transcriptional regulator [unclassified Mesorhizobium]|uniref:BTAD domain-containing putative transcriptional regulator n=1 Tax=unclassified Mesorhizobium TaxID=325217 RepID=UPI000FCB5B75|nr:MULTISPECIES: BTAD domain-containing putative transcriptional regulator [unclassified Mesorhizobium]TGP27104.1 transcriptional regulator [Mesorhizobium sp. M1D.F.Ca.ET.231.01.1.1]TGP39062.1 transcriptional regulator [Mesorhizobium sp. M1D.F.Ca.ET.234.01.1.1]TGS51270.1 transcriptional regulator [Mesorhizobium sp. M1D.F.Ca.ET.184.01.1.1]TGS67154.1 transcriptional regulator [Mesorhizobium sp. M1D.F.Ca.ET.183.01.1.1]